jgi:hypothetical protein
MSAKDPMDIFIPSIFVSEEAGLIIKDNYQFFSGYVALSNTANIHKSLHGLNSFNSVTFWLKYWDRLHAAKM